MATTNQNALRFSLKDLETSNKSHQKKSQVVCALYLNDDCIDSFTINNPDYQVIIPLIDGTDRIGVVLHTKDTEDIVGCISFSTQMFLPFRGKSFSQWITVFDSPEDDEFDGDIGVDDDEIPRALMNFSIGSRGTSSSSDDKKVSKPLTFNVKESPSSSNRMSHSHRSPVQGASSVSEEESFQNENNEHVKESSREKLSGIDHEQDQEEEDTHEERAAAHNIERDIQPLRLQFDTPSSNKVITSPSSVRSEPEEFQGGDAKTTEGYNEETSSALEAKIADLINVLKVQRPELTADCSIKQSRQSISSSEIEKDYLLQLEMEKNKMIENTLKQAELQLSKTEKLYKELEKKSKQQFQKIMEETKIINKENYDLKRRISEIESQSPRNRETLSEEGLPSSQRFMSGSEKDQAVIEKYEETIYHLERTNDGLHEELQKAKIAVQEEKNFTIKLQAEINKTLHSSAQDLEDLRAKIEHYSQEIKALSVEKNLLEKSVSGYKNRIEGFQVKNQSLEAELQLSLTEVERLTRELEDHKNLGANFRRMIDELIKERDGETADLKEEVEVLKSEMNSLQKEYEVALTSKKQLEQFVSYIKNADYENKVKALENTLIVSNDEKMSLQDKIIKLEAKIQQNSKEKAKKSENAGKEAKAASSEQSKMCDQLKFEMNELKLRLNEIGEVKEKNSHLQKKVRVLQEEGNKLRVNLSVTQKRLFATATELVKQTSVTIEQNSIITNLNQQMQILDESLKTAFKNIGKLQSNIQIQKKSDLNNSRTSPLFEIPSKGDIELKLLEFLAKNPIPLKFIPRGNDIYTFGSRRVKLELIKDRLTIKINGGNMFLEEFIRLYAHQELLKMKIVNLGHHFIDMEDEDVPQDIKDNQVIWDSNKEHYNSYTTSTKRAKTDASQYNSNLSRTTRVEKKESTPTNLTDRDVPNENDYIIFDITPQGTREAVTQNKSRGNHRSPYNDKKLDSTQIFASSLRNYDNEPRQKNSTRSLDPSKGSSTNKTNYRR